MIFDICPGYIIIIFTKAKWEVWCYILKKKDLLQIIEGEDQCFFEVDRICFHVDSSFEKCSRIKCDLYKSVCPLKKQF